MDSEPWYELKAEFFKTLGHPARIRVLELLRVARAVLAAVLSDRVAVLEELKAGQ